jgi:hypothetical protein
MGAPPPLTPPPGATVCDDLGRVCLPSTNYRLTTLQTDWLVFRFSRYSLCTDTQRTRISTIHLLLRDVGIGANRIENAWSNVVTVLFPNNGCLCWLHNPSFQQICHNILIKARVSTRTIYAFNFRRVIYGKFTASQTFKKCPTFVEVRCSLP